MWFALCVTVCVFACVRDIQTRIFLFISLNLILIEIIFIFPTKRASEWVYE